MSRNPGRLLYEAGSDSAAAMIGDHQFARFQASSGGREDQDARFTNATESAIDPVTGVDYLQSILSAVFG